MTCFIGVDPGETTGLVRWRSFNGVGSIETLQVPLISIGPVLRQFIEYDSHVACERFVIGTRTARKKRSHAPEIIGQVEAACEANDAKLTMQTASDAKAFGQDRTLKRLGWHFPGYRHATDAARHMLLLIAKTERSTFEKLVLEAELHG